MPCAFAGCLRTPRGWVEETLQVMGEKEELFRCRRNQLHHFNTQNDCNSCFFAILCWRISASRRNAGETVRSMPWEVLDQLVVLFSRFFMVQSAGIQLEEE